MLNAKVTPIRAGPLFADAVTGADTPPPMSELGAAAPAPAWPAVARLWVTAPPPTTLNAKVTPIRAGPLFADAVTGADTPPPMSELGAAAPAPAWPAARFWVTAPPPTVLNAKVTPIRAGPLFADAVTGADTPPPMSELGAAAPAPAWPAARFWVTAPPPTVLNAKVTPIRAGPLFADAVTGADTPPPMSELGAAAPAPAPAWPAAGSGSLRHRPRR